MKKSATPLTAVAAVIRSKNAGPYELTLDIIFRDRRVFNAVKKSGFFTRRRIAGLYSVPAGAVKSIIFFDPAAALKITMERETVSGGPGDTDVYGAQQHAPLLKLKIPL